VEGLLVDKMGERSGERTTTELRIGDVRGVVKEVYEMARATGSTWPGKSKSKGEEKESGVTDEEEEEEIGEDGEGGLADGKMLVSDEEDEERTPGRIRRTQRALSERL
jgi:hypothetical protein